jgi:threonine dehydratase
VSAFPTTYDEVVAAQERIAPYLSPTPLRHYELLDEAVGRGVRVLVKHENHQPTCAFKVRNALSAVTAMAPEELARGVIAATRGNHGQGVAYAARLKGVPCVVCVPHGNNPEKNAAMRALGAELVEHGDDYDTCLEEALRLKQARGLTMLHSTNDPRIIAGAGTITLEMLEQSDALDAMVVAVGGGSQAVGALTVVRAQRPDVPVYAVQAERAPAIHDGWHAGEPVTRDSADTFADGLATRSCYELTFGALLEGLAGFVTVSEAEIAEAIRILVRTTHNLAEGAGAAGLAGLRKLGQELAGKTVGIIISGGNIDEGTLRRVLNREL